MDVLFNTIRTINSLENSAITGSFHTSPPLTLTSGGFNLIQAGLFAKL